jgi:gliding motility-associated-like protein
VHLPVCLLTVITVHNNTKSAFTFVRDTCSPEIIFINQSTSDNNELLTYFWNFGDGDSSTLTNPTHTYQANGTYTVDLITNIGTPCADTSTIQLTYDSTLHILQASFELNDTFFCSPAAIVATNTSSHPGSSRWFLDGSLVSTGVNYSHTLDTPGVYTLSLIVENPASCNKFDTTTREITVSISGVAAFSMARDSCSLVVEFTNKSHSPSGLPITYQWYFGDGDSSTEKSPKHTYAHTDNYTVTLITNANTPCADTALNTYFIAGDSAQKVTVPNVFTPNGDELNDCFTVRGISKDCGSYRIKIYNRWGELYFSSDNPEECWNGKNNSGTNASVGVYYYIIEIKKPNLPKEELHGTLTLIRE